MASPPAAAGHPLRYEILHRNEAHLKSRRQDLINNNSDSNAADRDEKIQHLNVQTMFHRASLQCLFHSAAEVARREGKEEDVAALTALSSIECRRLEKELCLPLWPSSSNNNNNNKSEHNGIDSTAELDDLFEVPDDLADRFFEVYPDVARCEDDMVYSSSDESSVEEKTKKKRERGSKDDPIAISGHSSPIEAATKNELSNQHVQSNVKNQGAAVHSRPLNSKEGNNNFNRDPHRNMYSQSMQQQQSNFINQYDKLQYQQHPQQQPYVQQNQQNQWQNRPPTGCFDYNETNEGPPVPENEFRTAKELYVNRDDSKNTGRNNARNGNMNNGNGWGNQDEDQYRGLNNRNNRANNTSKPQQMVMNTLKKSQGLQKKFQNPKLGAANNNNNSGNNNSGGQMKKPDNCGNNTDDDELPEELKGLSKELIQRIENDIVDSGAAVTFDDIAGLDHAKRTVEEMIIMPMKNPGMFTGLREAPKGLLLFGPPGTGKTLIAKAISHESGATFFSISSSSLTSKWIGEGEQLVRTLYRVARYRAPSVVFIDEIDSLLTARKADENEASRRMKTEFLVQLDGAGNVHAGHVLTIGATNVPNELDDAARRRFVKKLYVALPTLKDREVLMRKLFSKNTHSITDKEFAKLAKNTEGYSGADLKNFCGEAAMGPLRQIDSNVVGLTPSQLPPISYKHCRRALKATSRSVSDADLKVHLEWNEMYGSKPSSGYNYDDTESDDESEDAEDS